MNTALFLFGMKLHKQQGSIEFFDADFSNTLVVSSNYFTDKLLGECCEAINTIFTHSGFNGNGVTVGKLKGIEDFELSQV